MTAGPGGEGAARRFDWHVLLPRPGTPDDRWLVLGAPEEAAQEVVRLGLAGAGVTAPELGAPSDVVAILDGATMPLETAAGVLSEGGTLYWEVDRGGLTGLVRTPGGLRRDLAAAGFGTAALYWVGPSFTAPRYWLPLDRAAPAAWYLATMGSRPGIRAWVRRFAALLVRSTPVGPLLAPRLAVIVGVGAGARPPIPAVLDAPETRSVLGSVTGLPIQSSGGDGAWSRITLLVFGRGARRPRAVIKVSRHEVFDAATRNEHDTLQRVRARLPSGLDATLPRPLASVRAGPRPAIAQEAMPGTSAWTRMTRPGGGARALEDLRRTAAWLVDVAPHLEEGRATPGSSRWRDHIDAPLERLAARPDLPTPIRRLLVSAADRLRAVATAIPIGMTHRDLGPWNVLVHGERIAVIDWEVARVGVPFTDLAYAALHWDLVLAGRAATDRRAAAERRPARLRVDRLFAAPGVRLAPVPSILVEYGVALGVEPAAHLPLTVLMLAQQALDRLDRRSRLGLVPEPATADPYLGYLAAFADQTRFD
jgi:hypothetical protein